MLTTRDGDLLRSRPMATAADENRQEFLFLTRASSHKADEIGRRTQVNLSFADPKKIFHLCIREGRLGQDQAIAHELWNRTLKRISPKGRMARTSPYCMSYRGRPNTGRRQAAAGRGGRAASAIATHSRPELGVNEKVQL